MLTIETKPGVTLGFVEVKTPSTVMYEFYPNKMDKIIGNLSEITEEQAREFFDNINPRVWRETGLGKLEAALIENGAKLDDFKNYLVIKL